MQSTGNAPKWRWRGKSKLAGDADAGALSQPTRDDRGWLMNPIGPNPWWTVLAALIPALLCTILIFMDQQITAVIVNRKEHRLKVRGCEGRIHPQPPTMQTGYLVDNAALLGRMLFCINDVTGSKGEGSLYKQPFRGSELTS